MKGTRGKVMAGIAVLLAVLLLAGCGGVPQEDLDAAKAEADAAKAQTSSLQSQLDSAKSDLSKARSDLSKARSDLSAAQTDLTAAQGELETATAERDKALSDAKSAASSLSSAKSAERAAKADLATAQAALTTKEAELAAVQAELDALTPAEEEEVVEEEEEAAEYEALPTYEHPAELSFDATEVTNDEYGISFKLPSQWTEAETDDIYASTDTTSDCTGMWVAAGDLDGNDTLDSFPQMLIDTLTEAPVEILKAGSTTLADGTPAYAAEYNCTLDGWAMHSVSVGLIVGDQWISYNIWNIDMYVAYDGDLFFEMAHTLLVQ